MSEHILCNEFKSFNMKADLQIGWTRKHTSRLHMADNYSLRSYKLMIKIHDYL